jgi:hypothetical protein
MINEQFEKDIKNGEYAKSVEYEITGNNELDCVYLDLYDQEFLCGYVYADRDDARADMREASERYGLVFHPMTVNP